MKFWKILKILSSLIEETLPDWQGKFLSYKNLKKQLKLIYPDRDAVDPGDNGDSSRERPCKRQRLTSNHDGDKREGEIDDGDRRGRDIDGGDGDGDVEVTKEVTYFVELLEQEIDKFNNFFVDKEEYYVIRLKVLQDKLGEARALNGDLMSVGSEIVDLHGEMVLLENYSALNYIGLVKILKKYDKRSGALIRLPFIQKVLQEPFFKVDVLNELVVECEAVLNQLFSPNALSTQSVATEGNKGCKPQDATKTADIRDEPLKVPAHVESEHMQNMYVKLVTSALGILKEIRSGSSTVDMFSLPPL